MPDILVAEKDMDSRKQLADLLIEAGYNVMVTNSAANTFDGILKKAAQIVILGGVFDEMNAGDLVAILKRCNRDLTIILVSDEMPLPVMRRVRREGIFYHALKQDRDDICQAVKCAVANISQKAA